MVTDASKIIRKTRRKRGEYHGHGPDGYKRGPYWGLKTNLDHGLEKERAKERTGLGDGGWSGG